LSTGTNCSSGTALTSVGGIYCCLCIVIACSTYFLSCCFFFVEDSSPLAFDRCYVLKLVATPVLVAPAPVKDKTFYKHHTWCSLYCKYPAQTQVLIPKHVYEVHCFCLTTANRQVPRTVRMSRRFAYYPGFPLLSRPFRMFTNFFLASFTFSTLSEKRGLFLRLFILNFFVLRFSHCVTTLNLGGFESWHAAGF